MKEGPLGLGDQVADPKPLRAAGRHPIAVFVRECLALSRQLLLFASALADLPQFGDAAQSMATLSHRSVNMSEQVDHAQCPSTKNRYQQEDQSRVHDCTCG